jgi:hypothetical protein
MCAIYYRIPVRSQFGIAGQQLSPIFIPHDWDMLKFYWLMHTDRVANLGYFPPIFLVFGESGDFQVNLKKLVSEILQKYDMCYVPRVEKCARRD